MTIKFISKTLLVASFVAFTLTGCTPSISPDTYGAYNGNQVCPVVKGVVKSTRVVKMEGTSSGVGTFGGAAAGAIAASTIGGGRGCLLATLGGGLLGAGIGNLAEKRLTCQNGLEYTIRTSDGQLVSIVQGLNPTFQRGQHVMIIYGQKSRVVADPDYS